LVLQRRYPGLACILAHPVCKTLIFAPGSSRVPAGK